MFAPRCLFALGMTAVLSAASAGQEGRNPDRGNLQTDLRLLEKYFTMDRGNQMRGPNSPLLVAPDIIGQVKRLPLGDELRREAIALAMRHARVMLYLGHKCEAFCLSLAEAQALGTPCVKIGRAHV